MLKHHIVPVTRLQQNCSIVWCTNSMQAAIIDPGGDIGQIEQAIQKLGLRPKAIWITHGHFDHVGGVAPLARALGVPIYGPHENDRFLIEELSGGELPSYWGFKAIGTFEPTRWLHDLDELTLGDEVIQVRHCPGHTPGHVVFHSASARHAFVGDVLFAGSIGRTDFPGGDHEQLIQSIIQRLWPMGNETTFTPGHGLESSFGQERQTNPFVGGT